MPLGTILIGTCGFAYDEWIGPFYPGHLARNRMLDFYADRFSALEIDATYYRVPSAKSARALVESAAGRLQFLIKAPGLVTHERRLDPDAIGPFSDYLQPFAEAQVLAGILFQFPQAFRCDPASLDNLRGIAAHFPTVHRIAEFRRAGWTDGAILGDLQATGWSLAGVDQPRLPGLSESLTAPVPARNGLAIFRFHGRNSEMWHDGDARSRYEYGYSPTELAELAGVVQAASSKSATTMAFFNNHARGLAPENAAQLATLLHLDPPRTGPTELDLFSS